MDDIRPALPKESNRFVALFRKSIRDRGLGYATEKTYLHWVLRYIRFHQRRHPRELGSEHISLFLSDLAVQRHCSVGTQRTALNALVFLYKHHPGIELPKIHFRYAGRPPSAWTRKPASFVVIIGITRLFTKRSGRRFAGPAFNAGLGRILFGTLSPRV